MENPFPNKKYQIIYADPPWSYQNYGYDKTKSGARAKRGVEKEYRTMSIDRINALPISNISADNCALFLWVTFPLLLEGLSTISAWGFDYKTVGFVWIKHYRKSLSEFWGMGNWTRSNSEICVIGVKGHPQRESANVHQIIKAPVGEHSKKPDIVRDRIVELCGDLPRIELFARQSAPGWDAWGNEVNKFDNEWTDGNNKLVLQELFGNV